MTKEEQTNIINNLYRLKSYGYLYSNYSHNYDNFGHIDQIPLEDLEHCNLCGASKLCDSKVIEYGNSNSKLVIISLLNITNENEKNLLKNMIEKVLLVKFDSIYMLNIVKCPIDNKDLKDEYIYQCIPFIKNQIIKMSKDIKILFIGDSFKYLNHDDCKIVFNQICEYQGFKSLLIPPLEYILKNPSTKGEIFEALKRFEILLEK
jgi:uracil-DNA glycosylase